MIGRAKANVASSFGVSAARKHSWMRLGRSGVEMLPPWRVPKPSRSPPIHEEDQVDQHVAVGEAADSSVVRLDRIPPESKLAAVVPVHDHFVGGRVVTCDQFTEIDVEPRVPHTQGDRIVVICTCSPFFDDTPAKGSGVAGGGGEPGAGSAAAMPCRTRKRRSVRRFTPRPPRGRARGASCAACCD